MTTNRLANTLHDSPYPQLMHGPTFMGNPLACSVACASIDLVLENDMPHLAKRMQSKLNEHLSILQNLPDVADVRCLGAIGVIEMTKPIDMPRFQALLSKYGIWVRPFGKLVYLMPPIIMNDDDLKQLCQGLTMLLKEYLGASL